MYALMIVFLIGTGVSPTTRVETVQVFGSQSYCEQLASKYNINHQDSYAFCNQIK